MPMTTTNRKWLTRLLDQLEETAELHPWLALGVVIASDEKKPTEEGEVGNGPTDKDWRRIGLELFDDAAKSVLDGQVDVSILSPGKARVRIRLPYREIWFKSEGAQLTATLTAHLDVRDQAEKKVWEFLEHLLPVTDLIMMDIKQMAPHGHQMATGKSNERIRIST